MSYSQHQPNVNPCAGKEAKTATRRSTTGSKLGPLSMEDRDIDDNYLVVCDLIIESMRGELAEKNKQIASLEQKVVQMSIELANYKASEDEHQLIVRRMKSDSNDSLPEFHSSCPTLLQSETKKKEPVHSDESIDSCTPGDFESRCAGILQSKMDSFSVSSEQDARSVSAQLGDSGNTSIIDDPVVFSSDESENTAATSQLDGSYISEIKYTPARGTRRHIRPKNRPDMHKGWNCQLKPHSTPVNVKTCNSSSDLRALAETSETAASKGLSNIAKCLMGGLSKKSKDNNVTQDAPKATTVTQEGTETVRRRSGPHLPNISWA